MKFRDVFILSLFAIVWLTLTFLQLMAARAAEPLSAEKFHERWCAGWQMTHQWRNNPDVSPAKQCDTPSKQAGREQKLSSPSQDNQPSQ